MKKNLTRLLALVLALCLLTGCGANTAQDTTADTVIDEANQGDFYVPDFDFTVTIKDTDDDPTIPEDVDITSIPVEEYDLLYTDIIANDFVPVRYVMIYNPDIYSETSYLNTPLSTGSIGTQVEVDLDKGGLEVTKEYLGLSQDVLNGGVPFDEFTGESDRAGALAPVYKVGDTKAFYCSDADDLNAARIARYFTCRYAGTYCNVWVADVSLSDALVKEYGTEFDTYIYESVVNTFGQARFTDNGGKVNLLYYPLPEGLGGFFSYWDLYASGEVTLDQITAYGLNTDEAILHINGAYADYNVYPQLQTFMKSVLSHEFQHLICATNTFETLNMNICDTWLNEAMSGYIEEALYPGVKEDSSGHMSSFRESYLISSGQSLYNFTTYPDDIGVYGSVYLYSTYLAGLAGNDVFSNFHDYWRNSYSETLSVAEALVNSVPEEVYYAIDASIAYPQELVFDTPEEEWMSKLTLSYYLELLDKEDTDPAAFGEVYGQDLLYNEINPANIEGGGRIIVALSGDEFIVPEDADPGLIYIGLDKDFNVVTSLSYPLRLDI